MSVEIELNRMQLDRIKRSIGQLTPKLQRKILREEARRAAKPLLLSAKSKAPVLTGRVKRAIKLRAIKKSRIRVGVAVSLGEGAYKGDTYYGAFVEFGHKIGKRPSRSKSVAVVDRRAEVPPRPFLWPTVDANGQHVLNNFANAVASRVEQELRNG